LPPVPAGVREYFDASPLAVAVVDAVTHELRYVNPAFRRFTETDGETVLGRPITDALPQSSADAIAALLRRTEARRESSPDVEIELAATAGERVYWSVSVWPVVARQRRGHLVVELRDVTDEASERRRRAELVAQMQAINERLLLAALREEQLTEQAQAANETKSVFLATMSHELRTPLTAIIGYEELLSTGITGPVTEAQQVQLARIKAGAVHLLALIDEVLSIARVDTHREIVHVERVDVGRICDHVSVLVAPLVAGKPIALRVLPPEQPIVIDSDPVKLRQILVNLVGNAIKFTDAGNVSMSVREVDGSVEFRVTDTGIGIRPEHLDSVFDDFWQVEQTRTRRAGGSGLGLAISRRLARLLEGDVAVESVHGKGSTFTLRVPLRYGGHDAR
jgi:PAS domain S-box-containing protein